MEQVITYIIENVDTGLFVSFLVWVTYVLSKCKISITYSPDNETKK